VRRWQREGMPKGMPYQDYFGIDKVESISGDITPQYEAKTIEETDTYTIYTTSWGVTMKSFKEEDSSPEFLDFTIKDASVWHETKKRIAMDESRLNLDYYKKHYPAWVADGRYIEAGFWFGFDVTHSWMCGTETVLIAMALEPEWVKDIIRTCLNQNIALFDLYWDMGYRFDAISWCDDMGYKGTSFFSAEAYRDIVQPFQKQAVDWAHNKGLYARLHSCGNINNLLPDILATGIDCLNPIEVKAGMDPLAIKRQYGSQLALHGGINAVLWDDREAVIAEIKRCVPPLKENGGYIFASDHSIPNTVSLSTMEAVISAVKEAGAY
jgi:uroporphyrinogen decarboxylase